MPRQSLPTKTGIKTKTQITVAQSLTMGIGIVAASVVAITFIAALLWPLTMKSLETKPQATSWVNIALSKNSALSQNIPRSVRDFAFLEVDVENKTGQSLSIDSINYKKLGNLPDRNIGSFNLVVNNQVLAKSSYVKDGRIYFKEVKAALKPQESKTLVLKATVLLPNSKPESTIGFSLESQAIEMVPAEFRRWLNIKEVKGSLMKVVSRPN